jgi:hypothetical protein
VFKIVGIFQVLILTLSLLIFSTDTVNGFIYLVSSLPLIIFLNLSKRRSTYVFVPIFLAVLAIFTFYFIRPVVLIYYPEFFAYSTVFSLDSDNHSEALILQGFFSLFYLLGLYLPLRYIDKRNRGINLYDIGNGALVKHKFFFYIVLIILSIIWLYLTAYLGVGKKLDTSNWDYLMYIYPSTLLIPLAFGYLVVGEANSWNKAPLFVTIFLMIIAGIITGSKSAIFVVTFYYIIYKIIISHNFTVSIKKIFFYTTIILLIIPLFVILANAIKYSIRDVYTVGEIIDNTILKEDFLRFILDRLTIRFTGYEGILVTLNSHPVAISDSANWMSIIYNGIAQLIPGIQGNSESLGKLVGMHYGGRDLSESHAGSLGMFGMLNYMHGPILAAFISMIIGYIISILFRLIYRLKNKGNVEYITILMVLAYLQTFWISSGNFDKLIQQSVMTVIHIVFYYYLFVTIQD